VRCSWSIINKRSTIIKTGFLAGFLFIFLLLVMVFHAPPPTIDYPGGLFDGVIAIEPGAPRDLLSPRGSASTENWTNGSLLCGLENCELTIQRMLS
jgi:hypothetical protein